MKTINVISAATCCSVLAAWLLEIPASAQEAGDRDAWEARMLSAIEDAKSLPMEQSLPKLETWLYQLSKGAGSRMEREGSPVLRAVETAITSIPGYAEYFAQEIDRITEAELSGVSPGPGTRRERHFDTLGHLPSVETVRVLGRFLEDGRDLAADWDALKHGPPRPTNNPFYAVMALEKLGLKNSPTPPPIRRSPFLEDRVPGQPEPPVPARDGSTVRQRVAVWRHWIEQARNGVRKISFEGDPREYSLAEAPDGGVSGGEPGRRPRLRPDSSVPSAQSLPASETGTSRPALPTLFAAAGILLAGLAWYLLRRGMARPPRPSA